MGEWIIDPHFLDLGTCWGVVGGQHHVAVALPPGRSPRYPLYRRLGGPQSRSGRFREVKILYPSRGSNSDPSVVQTVAKRYNDYATAYLTCEGIFRSVT
jgi:hypothetical protein